MRSSFLLLLSLFACCCILNSASADDKSTVEIYFSTDNVPAGLKPGSHVDLMNVTGKSVTRTGKVSITTMLLVPNLEVSSVSVIDKPKSPTQAVKVEFKVSKTEAERIEKLKEQRVTAMTINSQGKAESTKIPLTFRLEPTRPRR